MKAVYKGYYAFIRYSNTDDSWYGKVLNIKEIVLFKSKNFKQVIQEFHKAVDRYIAKKKKHPSQETHHNFLYGQHILYFKAISY